MSDSIRITRSATGEHSYIWTPFNADFIDDVKQIGGWWDRERRAWRVDARDEERARELLREHYGTDGSAEELSDLVSVQIRLRRFELDYRAGKSCGRAEFAGRTIAQRPARDAPVKLSSGVVLVEGSLPLSGGSMKYPEIGADGGVVVEVRDIPRSTLELYEPEEYKIVSETPLKRNEAADLRARRDELLAQVEEISQALAKIDPDGEAQREEALREEAVARAADEVRNEQAALTGDIIRRLQDNHRNREEELLAERQRERKEEERVRQEVMRMPLDCRCGAHTCPPAAPTVQEYAKAVGRTTHTVRSWVKKGQIPAVLFGGRYYITADN